MDDVRTLYIGDRLRNAAQIRGLTGELFSLAADEIDRLRDDLNSLKSRVITGTFIRDGKECIDVVLTGSSNSPVTSETAGDIILELQDRISELETGNDPNRLPIDEIPEGWLWSVESVDTHPEVDPFECLFIRYEGRKEHRYLASGPTPRAAMLAAIAKIGK